MRKVLASFIILLITCVFFVGCDSNQHDNLYNDDTEIAADSKYVVTLSSGTQMEDGSYQYTATSLSGAETLWHYDAAAGENITVSCSINVSNSGKAKLVLIYPDNAVEVLVESIGVEENYLDKYTITPTDHGLYRIKIVGADNPELTASLSLSHGNWGSN